jgi:RHS repeat-associated protein
MTRFRHWASHGNGNVLAYLDCASGTITQRTEYDAFGNEMSLDSVITQPSTTSSQLPFRFSTKYADTETGLSYYGYRFYSADLAGWPSRDPIAERGGINLYGMVGNDPVNRVDYLGLEEVIRNGYRMAVVRKPPPKECCDKAGAKAINCFNITIWASSISPPSMAVGHASFGLPGQTQYGFHGSGYLDDDVDMKGYNGQKFECCCLTDEEMKKLQDKIKQVQDKIAKNDNTDLNSRTYSPWNTADPNPTCSGSAAGFAGGMGCPNIQPTDGTSPAELLGVLKGNKFCKGL